MKYNTSYRMPDFFMNPKLGEVFPQITEKELNLPSDQLLNENVILDKVTGYLVTALRGERAASGITVIGNYVATAAKIRGLATVCEGIFSSMPSITKNVKSKSKVYTTVSTIDQIKTLSDITSKIAYMNQILENVNYNKDFNSLCSVGIIEQSKTKATFNHRQLLWENKVGYKQDPRLARMNESTGYRRTNY